MKRIEDEYSCDGCGKILPFDDVTWYTSTIGFCRKCATNLYRNVPLTVRNFCYDEIEGGDNDVAEFICERANN